MDFGLVAFLVNLNDPFCTGFSVAVDFFVALLFEQNWDDILRLIATIMLKETTASEIFRRLNSYSQQHALYRALKAFGKIIKSTFIGEKAKSIAGDVVV